MRALLIALLGLTLIACSHPLSIEGRGDIIELNNFERGCTYNQFQNGDIRCENWVVMEDYNVRYAPNPRQGWRFVGWTGLACGFMEEPNICGYDFPRSYVDAMADAAPNTVFPATIAVFEPATAVAVAVNGSPFEDNRRYQAVYQITNTSDIRQPGVQLVATIAQHSGPVAPAQETTPPGNCADGGAVCTAGEEVVWAVGNLEPGEVKVYAISEFILTSALDGDVLSLPASVLVNGGISSDSASEIVISERMPDLQVDITSSGSLVAPGELLTQSIVVSNLSSTLMADELQVVLDANTAFVSATGGGSHANGVVTWPVSVGAGGSDSRELIVSVTPDVNEGAFLSATAIFSDTLNVVSASDTEHRAVSAANALSLQVSSAAGTAVAGSVFTVTYTLTNNGDLPATNVTLDAILPAYLGQVTPATEATPAAVCNSGGTACSAGQSVRWSLGALPAGETRVFSITENIAPNVDHAELMTVTAIVKSTNQSDVLSAHTVVLSEN